ncbi:SMP-30/gluconolactonase/LRE family protein [Pigmentiphaga sp.]|uniref:SMP-30/gluconolactonase/LRE family protein n=1 Tax=Pigmentiphaga sp. TaxID=1977564 RepID=UPI00128E52E4|nr:SMP-30/gluconolactonase/LRE family protein [Pigmentiphaga sp.]MPS25457.1 hypothetical protein [Alcaligenaceae bacterium SAGV5]MPS54071.1 hypothetical protein [Alcaligenaceae bacterium SAGV3]MPT58770.1 hypothetical protein [Alcaligenaceae bacterium]
MSFSVSLSDVETVGHGLRRPECVLCNRHGDMFVAHLGHGIMHIAPDGTQRAIGNHAEVDGAAWIPNGIAWMPDNSFLVANMGPAGGLWRLTPEGALELVLAELDGLPLGATNFVMLDDRGRTWVTVTTRQWPISKAFAALGGPTMDDGYLILIDAKGPRIVADGFAFANEVRIDAGGRHVYVVETFGRRVTRFALEGDHLVDRTVFARFGHGTFADGAAFDAEGHLWAASIVSNRLLRIAPDGSMQTVLEELDPRHVDRIERRLAAGTIAREDVQHTPTRVLKNIASVTFGGPDLRTVYLGSLGGDTLGMFRSPVAGVPPVHWNQKFR